MVVEEENEIVSVDGYLEIAKEEGFQVILILPFVGDENAQEKFYILFHKEYGALLVFDTSEGVRINEGILYYNLKLPCYEHSEYFGSGEWYGKQEYIWIGGCHVRGGLRLRLCLKNLRDLGQFITPWVKRPFLWLLHHADEEIPNYDYKVINQQRISQLPEEVQKVICP